MRKVMVAGLVALLVVTAASFSLANVVPQGTTENKVKLTDVSSHYRDVDNGDDGERTPVAYGVAPMIGDELRAVLRVETLHIGDAAAYWVNHFSGTNELTGIFYDLELTRAEAGPSGEVFDGMTGLPVPGAVLYYSPLDRNALTTDNVPVGGDIGGFGGESGGVIEIYCAPSNDADNMQGNVGAGGPSLWVEGAGGASRDEFDNATDGDLWLSGVFLELEELGQSDAMDGEVYRITFALDQLGNIVGTGSGVINAFDGFLTDYMTFGSFGPFQDVLFSTTITFAPQPGDDWQASSDDPARFTPGAIPEPTIMALFGVSVIGGLIRRRRAL